MENKKKRLLLIFVIYLIFLSKSLTSIDHKHHNVLSRGFLIGLGNLDLIIMSLKLLFYLGTNAYIDFGQVLNGIKFILEGSP